MVLLRIAVATGTSGSTAKSWATARKLPHIMIDLTTGQSDVIADEPKLISGTGIITVAGFDYVAATITELIGYHCCLNPRDAPIPT